MLVNFRGQVLRFKWRYAREVGGILFASEILQQRRKSGNYFWVQGLDFCLQPCEYKLVHGFTINLFRFQRNWGFRRKKWLKKRKKMTEKTWKKSHFKGKMGKKYILICLNYQFLRKNSGWCKFLVENRIFFFHFLVFYFNFFKNLAKIYFKKIFLKLSILIYLVNT